MNHNMKLPKGIRELLDSNDSNNHYLVKEMITHMDITMYDIIYYMLFESKNLWDFYENNSDITLFDMDITIYVNLFKSESEVFKHGYDSGNEFMVYRFDKNKDPQVELDKCIKNIIKEIK